MPHARAHIRLNTMDEIKTFIDQFNRIGGIDKFMVEDFEGKNVEQIGFGVLFDIAGIIIANIPKAEDEIQTFLASLSGMKVTEIISLDIAEYSKDKEINKLIQKEEKLEEEENVKFSF